MQEYSGDGGVMGRIMRAPERGAETAQMHADFTTVLSARVEPMIRVMSRPASALLLIGEAGSGKCYMAEYVARTVEDTIPRRVRTLIFPHPTEPHGEPEELFRAVLPEAFGEEDEDPEAWLSETFRASKLARNLIEAAHTEDGVEPLMVLPGIDRYSPRSTAVLEHLIRQQGVRIIGTARRMTGGANHMGRDPRVIRLPVGPLDLQEADALMSSLLGTGHLAPITLRRWHAATGGNSHALTLMLIANERSGMLRRRQGVARVAPGREEIPEEFTAHLDETCNEAERATLEMLAMAEPMVEAPLLRLLDPVATNALLDRNLLSSSRSPQGEPMLCITRPIFAAAIRARMSPYRRIELADLFFRELTEGRLDDEFAKTSPHLVRAVAFGLERGAKLPHDWLAAAVSQLVADADPHLMLRVSLALACGYASEDAAAAAIRSMSYAVQLGEAAAIETAYRRIGELLKDPEACAAMTPRLRTRLRIVQIDRSFFLGTPMSEVLQQLDELEASLDDTDSVSHEAVRVQRFLVLLRNGDFAAANPLRFDGDVSEEILIEWVRAPARSASALLLVQQGQMERGIRVAYRARSIALIGRRPLHDTAELQSFHWFLGYWASGSSDGARRALEEIEEDAHASRDTGAWMSDLIEAGWAMLALQEARWRDAADMVELILESASAADPYGMNSFLNAVHALALAALGDREAAVAALQRAKQPCRGLSQALGGVRRRLIVQAQQWLRLGDPGSEALSVAVWARLHGLGLIELEALHSAAVESRALARGVQERARELVGSIDPIIAEVILAHIEKIAAGASPTDVSEPEVRLLADLGLWLPLPKSSALSAREREIALLASLGYSSRFIAERFHLSGRTVETHLAHVYGKLGIVDREELRGWFSADRRAA